MAFQSSHSPTGSASATAGAANSNSSSAANSSSTATGEDGSSNPPPLTPGSSSLPFSFLVTFIAIFLFFLGCGLGSRRVTRTLRRNFGLDGDNRGRGRAAFVARERPLLWDVCPLEGQDGGGHAWAHLRPLCASYVRTVPAAGFSSSTGAPQAQTHLARRETRTATPSVLHWAPGGMGAMGFALSRAGLRSVPVPAPAPTSPTPRAAYPLRARPTPRPPRWHGHQVPDWLVRMLAGPAPVMGVGRGAGAGEGAGWMNSEQEMYEKQPVQALQVLTVITMPSPERAAMRSARAKAAEAGLCTASEGDTRPGGCADPESFGEYVLGVARVDWDSGEVDVAEGGGER